MTQAEDEEIKKSVLQNIRKEEAKKRVNTEVNNELNIYFIILLFSKLYIINIFKYKILLY
jgi:hypothetical protein